MAEKKNQKAAKKPAEKKNTAKKSTEIVDSASQLVPDEVGLVDEPKMEELEELENPSTEEFTQDPDDGELVFDDNKDVTPEEKVVETEECDVEVDGQSYETVENQEIESSAFESDPEMVNDITNILNGLDGVKANKIGEEEEHVEEPVEKKEKTAGKNMSNTEEKNYYSEQFSRSWGGVMYDY